MAIDQSQRPTFYEGQYLGAGDLTAIVEEGVIREARHILGAHTWGIAFGLDLREVPSPQGGGQVDVFLVPGYAWDGFGRTITVLAPYKIPAEKFASCVFDQGIDGGSPPGRLLPIWLQYREVAAQPSRLGFAACEQGNQATRVPETFDLVVGDRSLFDQRDHVVIAGRSVDAADALKTFDPQAPPLYDTAVPDQTFPEQSPSANWLIPLGAVRWLPSQDPTLPGHLVQTAVDDRQKSRVLRRYAGAVAEAIQTPAGRLRLRARSNAPSPVLSDDLVWVEGTVRVDDDVKLFGGKLDFRTRAGQDLGIPLTIQRAANTQGGQDLQVIIGQATAGQNRFAIGPLAGPAGSQTCDVKFVIQDDGSIGVGTTAPRATLDVEGTLFVSGRATKHDGPWWSYISDRTLKENIAPLSDALKRLLRLRGVSFEWKEPGEPGRPSGRHMGLIAQEVQRIFPEWVSVGRHGYREMNLGGFEALIIEALRELKADAEVAEARLRKCERRIEALQKFTPPRSARRPPE